jgi:ribosomal protein S18 acetylase RimI-like enzyme
VEIEIKSGFGDEGNVIALFGEYTAMLEAVRPDVKEYLKLQNYDHELRHLHEKYGAPAGILLLAYLDGEAAGCIALRKLSETEGEMKRLFVRPQFRRYGIATALAERLLAKARALGYRFILLDTLPELTPALAFYEKLGFQQIEAYNDSPVAGTVFLQLEINSEDSHE